MERTSFIEQIKKAFRVNPIVAILGPRRCGKTTLARQYINQFSQKIPIENYFDLEDITDIARLTKPKLTLENLEGLIVIDEIQRIPDLFPTLRVLVDKPQCKQTYLILGSAARELIQQSSETLAGRISYIELTPFTYMEMQQEERLWMRGGFPQSYLAKNMEESYDWRQAYIQSFLEQDIPMLGIKVAPLQLRRFWMMITHYHGNVVNASEIGRSLSLSYKTTQHYLDILSSTFMIRQLQPWFENIAKRQVKSPKIYFRDSGILHALMGISDKSALLTHPKLGASWEGFAMEQILCYHQAIPQECYFWAVHNQGELDLLIIKNGKRLGFEIKHTDAPTLTSSIKMALEYLQLDKLVIIYPGKKNFRLAKNVEVWGFESYLQQ